ncbi:MAG TPA: SURF1 family protein [Jatrophihabitantaceae bacterium]|nr:SURF1 family protein [Jatrophihabitantaceae bacterium]
MLKTLRQPRYAALTVFMVFIAGVCIGLGTWQIVRLGQKMGWNDELRNNAHEAPRAVADVLPIVGKAATPGTHAIQFKRVTATGTFDVSHQYVVRLADVNSQIGFYVLTPLDTREGTLLVVRGFLPDAVAPASIPAPPAGSVSVIARVEPGQSRNDDAGRLTAEQVESINPVQQAARLGRPVYNAYAELLSGQPGVGSLTPIPDPDLSNPAGGAVEPQHVAYIIQWFLFAALALAAPVAMARAETRHRDERDFDATETETDTETGSETTEATHAPGAVSSPTAPPGPSLDEQRAARLADRYGKSARTR